MALVLLLPALLSALGCGTVETVIPGLSHVGPDEFGFYSGVRRDVWMAQYDGWWAIDVPFSFALDTALLPISIWFSIFGASEPGK